MNGCIIYIFYDFRSNFTITAEMSQRISRLFGDDDDEPFNATFSSGVPPDMTLLNTATPLNRSEYTGRRIGLGCAITMAKIPTHDNPDIIKSKSPFFKHLLPSFCDTASQNFSYIFFIGYDFNDRYLSKPENRITFFKIFDQMRKKKCNGNFEVQLRFVLCNHTGQPARAQNDALMAGYFAGMDYLYMVNDDTLMQTHGWTERFIQELAKFSPRNVGMVGPTHSGGNTAILTYNFVHRTHVDIFKSFYPRNFTDWYADRWISMLYLPNNCLKVPDVKLKHTMELGRRYNLNPKVRNKVSLLTENSRKILRSYLEMRGIVWDKWTEKQGKKS